MPPLHLLLISFEFYCDTLGKLLAILSLILLGCTMTVIGFILS